MATQHHWGKGHDQAAMRGNSPLAAAVGTGLTAKQPPVESLGTVAREILVGLEGVTRAVKHLEDKVTKAQALINNAKDELKSASTALSSADKEIQKHTKTAEKHATEVTTIKWTFVVVGGVVAAIVLTGAALANIHLLPWVNIPRPLSKEDLRKNAEDIAKQVNVHVESSGRDMANKLEDLHKQTASRLAEMDTLLRSNRSEPGQGIEPERNNGSVAEIKEHIAGILEVLKAQRQEGSNWQNRGDSIRAEVERKLYSKVEEIKEEVAKAIAEVRSEGKTAYDAITKKIDAVSEINRKESGDVLKAVTQRLDDAEKARTKKAEELTGRLSRLEASLNLPRAEDLYSVAIVVDGGQALASYGDRPVRQAVIEAVAQAVRQTEARPVGVIWNRGGEALVIEKLDRHFAEDAAAVASRLSEGLIPTPGERSDWTVGLQRALGLLVLQESQRRRVVQISFAESAENPSVEKEAKLAETARKNNIEVWTVQMMTPGSAPVKGFVDVALKSGGQFVSVPVTEPSMRDNTATSISGRVRTVLLHSLSLPGPMEPLR